MLSSCTSGPPVLSTPSNSQRTRMSTSPASFHLRYLRVRTPPPPTPFASSPFSLPNLMGAQNAAPCGPLRVPLAGGAACRV